MSRRRDETLMAELRAVFASLDPVPDRVDAAGRDAFRWRLDGAVLASSASDTATRPAGVRGHGRRELTFTGPGVTVEIEVTGQEIAGQLTPPTATAVRLRSPNGERRAHTDEAGCFVLSRVPSGPVSLVFELPDGTSVVTSWVRV